MIGSCTQFVDFGLRNPGSCIRNRELQQIIRSALIGQRYTSTARVLDRVADQIDEDLLQPLFICVDAKLFVMLLRLDYVERHSLDLDNFLEQLMNALHQARHQNMLLEQFDVAAFDLRVILDVKYQVLQEDRVLRDYVQVLL